MARLAAAPVAPSREESAAAVTAALQPVADDDGSAGADSGPVLTEAAFARLLIQYTRASTQVPGGRAGADAG